MEQRFAEDETINAAESRQLMRRLERRKAEAERAIGVEDVAEAAGCDSATVRRELLDLRSRRKRLNIALAAALASVLLLGGLALSNQRPPGTFTVTTADGLLTWQEGKGSFVELPNGQERPATPSEMLKLEVLRGAIR